MPFFSMLINWNSGIYILANMQYVLYDAGPAMLEMTYNWQCVQ